MPNQFSRPPAPGEETSQALALVNTQVERRGEEVDLVPDGSTFAGWLRAHGLTSRRAAAISDEDLQRMRELRIAIRAAFMARSAGCRPPRAAMTTINDAATVIPSTRRLRWGHDGPVEETVWPEGSQATDVAFAKIAGSAITTLLGDSGNLLRLCEAHGCNRMFIADHGRRRWCSRACGDRVRVARHYRKLNGAP